MPRNDPLEVRAVVSFDQQTVANAAAQDQRNYATQKSIKNATWWAFGAVTAYAVVTTFMWCQMIKQNRIASTALRQSTESFRIDERAWIAPFDVQPEQNSAGETYFKVLYRNTGKTPALRTSSWIGTIPVLDQIPNEDTHPDGTAAYGLMAPNGVFNTSTIDHPFRPEVIAIVQSGTPLYIYGTIWYGDIFVRKRALDAVLLSCGDQSQVLWPMPVRKA